MMITDNLRSKRSYSQIFINCAEFHEPDVFVHGTGIYYIGGTGGPIATFCNGKFTRTNSSHGKCRVTSHGTFSYDNSVWCRNIEGELVFA